MIKSNNSIKNTCYIYILSLLPLILFGFYKNGISLYIKDYVSIFGMLKPLLFIILGFGIGISVNIVYEKIIKKNDDKLLEIMFSSFHPIYGLLIPCISSINSNILLFSIITFIVLFGSKFINNNKVNYVALSSLIIYLTMNIFGEFSFLNIYESSNNFNMNTIDYFFGRGSGGIFATNIIILIISFLVLYYSKVYKRTIAIFSSITFVIFTIIYCFFINNIDNIMNILFTNNILFSFVFIATDSISSSYTKKGMILYGALVGVITFIVYIFNPILSSLIGILIASMLNSIIDLKFE